MIGKMPKKFKGENSKAVQAKARKEVVRLEEKERKQKEVDDEYWRDDDKHSVNKQNRKVRHTLIVPLTSFDIFLKFITRN